MFIVYIFRQTTFLILLFQSVFNIGTDLFNDIVSPINMDDGVFEHTLVFLLGPLDLLILSINTILRLFFIFDLTFIIINFVFISILGVIILGMTLSVNCENLIRRLLFLFIIVRIRFLFFILSLTIGCTFSAFYFNLFFFQLFLQLVRLYSSMLLRFILFKCQRGKGCCLLSLLFLCLGCEKGLIRVFFSIFTITQAIIVVGGVLLSLNFAHI
jgi:hypothetical protein